MSQEISLSPPPTKMRERRTIQSGTQHTRTEKDTNTSNMQVEIMEEEEPLKRIAERPTSSSKRPIREDRITSMGGGLTRGAEEMSRPSVQFQTKTTSLPPPKKVKETASKHRGTSSNERKSAAAETRTPMTTPPAVKFNSAGHVDAGPSSPPPAEVRKACKLTVAQCLAEFRPSRSCSLSPIPQSPPKSANHNRPPRPRPTSSSPALKLVANPTTEVENTIAQPGGSKKLEMFCMNLDAILSKLSPIEAAKYLRAKVEVLEGSIGQTIVADALTGTEGRVVHGIPAPIQPGKTVLETTSPPLTPPPTTKELRKKRRAEKKQAKLEKVEQTLAVLERERCKLKGEGKRKTIASVPSPQESGKGHPSKRPTLNQQAAKGLKEKYNKCKAAADARSERMGCTHRLGSVGVAGLMKLFAAEFHREITEEEIEIRKKEGQKALFEIVYNRLGKGKQIVEDMRCGEPATKKPT